MEFKLGELFCGPGGMALGAKLADTIISNDREYKISHVWGVDKDPNAISTYNSNNLGEGIGCDAVNFAENIKTDGHKTISDFANIDALAFGFPCNDFSSVGERKGFEGKYGNLYKAGIAAINYANPVWFIAENVSGIHSANSGKAFRRILKELEESGDFGGYNVTVHLYKFEEYGVPQYRHRYIIVGIRKDFDLEFKVPAPTHIENFVSAGEALSREYDEPVNNNEYTKQSHIVQDRLFFTPPWQNAWFLEKLLEMTSEARRAALQDAPWYGEKISQLSDEEILNRIISCKLNCEKAKMSHIYRRLHPDKPSYTITGSGGGGTHVYHWDECRALTNRERARLQSFPDDFIFKGTKESVRKQIGMAVPPAGAKIIFEAILKTFAGINYPFSEPSYSLPAESL